MTTFLIAAFALGMQPTQVPKLDLSNPGITFRNLAPEIEAQTGWKVKLSPEVENEVIVIRTAGKPTEETLARIGEATLTTWKFDGDELTVRADVEARSSAHQNREDNFWTALLQKMDRQLRAYGSEGGVESSQAHVQKAFLRYVDLVRSFPPERLTVIGPDQRIVFAASPNRMQQQYSRLPRVIPPEFLETFKNFQAYSFDALKSVSDLDLYLDIFGLNLELVTKQQSQRIPEKLLLAVSRKGFTAVEFELLLIDGQGGVTSLFLSEFNVTPDAELENLPKSLEERNGDNLKLVASKEYQSFAAYQALSNRDKISYSFANGVVQNLRSPDEFEPLRWEGGELLLSAAEALKTPLVASLHDYMDIQELEKDTVQGVRSALVENALEEDLKSGWWIVHPSDRLMNWERRVDRQRFQQMLGVVNGVTWVNMYDVARLEYDYPTSLSMPFVTKRLALYGFSSGSLDSRPELLSMLGGIPYSSFWQVLRQGDILLVSSLPKQCQEIAKQLTFGAIRKFERMPDDRSTPFNRTTRLVRFPLDDFVDAKIEPTESFPNGLPAGATLSIKSEWGHYLNPQAKEPQIAVGLQKLHREFFVLYKTMASPGFLQKYETDPTYSMMNLGEYRDGELLFSLTNNLGLRTQFFEYSQPDRSKAFSLFNLPAKISETAQEDIAEFLSSPEGKFLVEQRKRLLERRKTQTPPPGASDLPANRG